MTHDFTYDLSSTDSDEAAVANIRLEIDDTDQMNGVKPNGSNYTNFELLVFYNNEGQHIKRAVAAACEALARAWSRHAISQLGPFRQDVEEVANNYSNRASDLRRDYGFGDVDASRRDLPFSVPMGTVDP